jgi:hypothetical protein
MDEDKIESAMQIPESRSTLRKHLFLTDDGKFKNRICYSKMFPEETKKKLNHF